MAPTRKYDSTIARVAGNIAAGVMGNYSAVLRVFSEAVDDRGIEGARCLIAAESVALARAIIAEVERTEPLAAPKGEDQP